MNVKKQFNRMYCYFFKDFHVHLLQTMLYEILLFFLRFLKYQIKQKISANLQEKHTFTQTKL